jgi:putative membrane protein
MSRTGDCRNGRERVDCNLDAAFLDLPPGWDFFRSGTMEELKDLASHAPAFFIYFAAGLVFLAVYFKVYTVATKYDEMELIRHGNMAAAYSLVGSAAGFALPLGTAISHTASAQAFVFWALVAMVAQIATYFFLKLLLKDVDAQIEANNAAYGLLDGGISLAVGIINAGCVA